MTADDFRRLVLAHRDVVEGAHMGHPDFRVHKKVVASLRATGERGMVKVTPDEQADLIREHPGVFEPEAGAWGRQGCTRVLLEAADAEVVGPAVTMAVRLGRGATS
jgi:hypothetical protein